MATGIPKTKWNGGRWNSKTNKPVSNTKAGVFLSYNGKKSENEILVTPPANPKLLWPSRPQKSSLQNRLYFGDNLLILAHLLQDQTVRGKVRLIYIDPPFATKMVYQSRSLSDAYLDLLSGPAYVEFLRERLIFLRELLADDGSIYIHLDENMAFPMKVIMDEVFGDRNYRNWITRKKCNTKNYTRRTYGNISDYILFYSKSDTYVWNRPLAPWTPERVREEYDYLDDATGRRYKKVPVHAPGIRNGETGKPWRGMNPPPGKHWQFPPKTLDAMDARGEIYWSPNGNPRRKIYFNEHFGIPIQDIWLDCRDAHNQNISITGYPTEKNPQLTDRIVAASSNPGDIVLDCFCGSGTTLAAAAGSGRRWIGIDNSDQAIVTCLTRFAEGTKPMGDFVGKRGNGSERPVADNLPLFQYGEVDFKGKKPEHSQNFISDFWLYTTQPQTLLLKAAVKKFRRKFSERTQKAAKKVHDTTKKAVMAFPRALAKHPPAN